ncbi:EAL domain-containing protein [Clostridium tagluense]|uniref:bifunctional diguanylate cyclase/phosphodiesterase n=1 Tax=Clostridium tagluense TaxID=360422 RepID=UPI001C0E5793|nr:EAL domain-containing protein [Clostridium tagluense]MBU3127820.1 EAL domain-containing protein [Clostridium tagluense]MCB2310154.1 EAL domain-containing protein [Clostridium tagluense]MCB2315204.1 EAL domain-containing protein [Clostridium tagluense]MCB2319854.1 EAL domain-containing protein [Clostridium tagluense]MCB2324947.1 EAL domain-containing protein [Clostridium tagluense]
MIKNKSKLWYKKIKILKYFAAIFLPLLIILLSALAAVNNLQIQKDKQIFMEREKTVGKINKLNIQTTFNSVTADLKVIKDAAILNDYVNNSTTQTISELNKMFMRFSKTKTIYDQLRLINVEGMEIARVDYNGGNIYIASPKQLQNKKQRDYFKATMNLKPKEIYISQFDLNLRNEETNKPTIHFGVPIFKGNGEKFGVLIFNYLGKNVLDEINENVKQNREFNVELLNSEGYFLRNRDEKHISFKSENKDMWDIISHNENGYLENKKNIYYYDTIYPLSYIREKRDVNFTHSTGYTYWKTIISYPKDEFSFIKKLVDNGFLDIGYIFFIIILVSSAVITHIIFKRQEALERLKAAGNIFDNSKEAILITDAETRITYVNKAFLHITGYSEDKVLGIKTSYFKSGKHNKEFYKNMWQSIITYGNWQGEIWDRKKNGEFYPKLLNILAIKGDNDKDTQYVGIFEDLTLLKEKEEKINILKNYDGLTSLPNLSLMKELMHKKISENSNMEDCKYYLVSLTVTNYDIVKNGLGLKKADSLIVTTLKRIKNHMEDNFIIGSSGKNEFMILLECIKNDNIILEFATNVLNEFKNPFLIEDEEIIVQLAMGVTSYEEDSDTVELLIENANIAKMYAAEEAESNVKFYKHELKEEYLESIKIKQLLRGALERGELYLTYQPQVDLESGQIVGTEALIRWKSPELGNISPVRFIPLAEKTGLILPFGEWVLDEALRQTKRWRDQKLKPILMSVNISPVQFKKVDVFKIIKEKLKKYDLSGESLEIEVTEGLLLDDDPNLMTQLENINNIGVRLAMDDFGTGYSSLSYLRKFKFHKIKIDREFVKDYPENDDGTIAKTIINLSKNLEITVIAEGAETEEQIDFLRKNKCDQIQGYYYSPPVLPGEFEKLLKSGHFEKK